MKNILFKCDEAFFNKLKSFKLKTEKKKNKSMTWEEFIKELLGLSNIAERRYVREK